ncbi:RIP metalloprotease RseP [Peptoniphilus catoniae]|uniref:RIP metalloprotease RseP n=1 Tax=Peptoniphilus catoniae TaxID=1660341 RepID=UPI0010FE8F6B|nr:RIP metalloprotease RseP [Peptoniphilus catoniae]
MYTLIGSIFVFMLVILLHEFGHYSVAKLVGIKVNEFSVGMGPKLIQKQKGETKYSLRALPIGGYVAMEGEEESSDDPRSFSNVSVPKRMAVVVAGVFMNLVLAILSFIILASIMGVPSNSNIVGSVKKDSPAMVADIKPGDKVIKIDNELINSWEDIIKNISKKDPNKDINLVIERRGESLTKTLKPIEYEGYSVIGIGFSKSFGSVVKFGFTKTFSVVADVFSVLGGLLVGGVDVSMLAGPVGVISAIGQATSAGFVNLIFILGIISANLAVVNILPIPALDGGKLLFLIIEAIRGKKVNEKIESALSFAGLVFLFGIMIYVTIFGDLTRLRF